MNMKTMRNWIVGLTLVALLGTGVVAVAGNGFGASAQNLGASNSATGDCVLHERDADGDGIVNSEDSDWVQPLDGTGYGVSQGQGYGCGLFGNRALDGSGFGGHGTAGRGIGGGLGDGTCI